jgi:AraC-like DNA-binding protein
MTPVQLLAQTRLNAAIRLLSTTDASITEVAHTCGYADHSAFSRQFRASVGITPTEYRNRAKLD